MRSKILMGALTLLLCNGCMGGSTILGAAPYFEPIGRWLLGDMLGLNVEEKADSLKAKAEYLVKQFVDEKLKAVAPHADMTKNELHGVFSRKNGGKSLFVLEPTGVNTATLVIYNDSGAIEYPLERELPEENRELLQEQSEAVTKATRILEKLKAKKERPPE